MAHGKSTLSKLIAGLLKPKSGRITVDNINIQPSDTDKEISKRN